MEPAPQHDIAPEAGTLRRIVHGRLSSRLYSPVVRDEDVSVFEVEHTVSRGAPWPGDELELENMSKEWKRPRVPSPRNTARFFLINLQRQISVLWSRSPYLKPITLFLLVETMFLVFMTIIWDCFVPIPGTANGEHYATLIRGFLNVVLISWQSLAIIPILSVVNFVYSSEWYYIYHRDCYQLPSETATLISSLNGGWLLRFRHIVSRGPSNSFRLSFLVALLCTVLTGVGPSSVAILPSVYEEYGKFEVADIASLGDVENGGLNMSEAAESVFRVSRDLPINALIPEPIDPKTQSLPSQVNLTYNTDIIQFWYNCTWGNPSWNTTPGANSAVFDGDSNWTVSAAPGRFWRPWLPLGPPPNMTAGVFQLIEKTTSNTTDGTTAFLFIGNNASVSQERPIPLDLAMIPSLYKPDGFPLITPAGTASKGDSNYHDISRLASILLCSPTLLVRPAIAVVQPDAWLTLGDVPPDQGSLFGNVRPDAAGSIFSQLWAVPMQEAQYVPSPAFVPPVAQDLFGLDPGIDEVHQSFYFAFLLPSPEDASQFVPYMNSLARTTGQSYMHPYTGANSSNNTFSTSYTRTEVIQRITVNAVFLKMTCVLIAAITVLIAIAANLPSARDRRPLDMQTVLELVDEILEDEYPSRTATQVEEN